MTTARHYYEGRRATPNLVVIHSLEYPEWVTSAEDAERYFATTDRKASVHAVADSDTVTRPVDDEDTAFGAAGVNSRALHIEHAGYAEQTAGDWLDAYGRAMLPRSAKQVAAWCRKYGVPPVRLTVEQVRAGAPGICSHFDVGRAFPDVSTGHTDPGSGFPWDHYLGLVRAELEDDMPLTAADLEAIARLIDQRLDKAEARLLEQMRKDYTLLNYGANDPDATGTDAKHVGNLEIATTLGRIESRIGTGGEATSGVPDGTYTITVEKQG